MGGKRGVLASSLRDKNTPRFPTIFLPKKRWKVE
jgi:hypothetical protein